MIELENLKSDRKKTDEIRTAAKNAIRWLSNNEDKYEVIFYCNSVEDKIRELGLNDTIPDIRICACAWMAIKMFFNDHVIFVTHDISCRNIAIKLFGLDVKWFKNKETEEYTGYKEVVMTDDDMAYFYGHPEENNFGLLVNQYLIIKNKDYDVVDSYRWDGEKYQITKFGNIKSDLLG